jgi:hypothetical protein
MESHIPGKVQRWLDRAVAREVVGVGCAESRRMSVRREHCANASVKKGREVARRSFGEAGARSASIWRGKRWERDHAILGG